MNAFNYLIKFYLLGSDEPIVYHYCYLYDFFNDFFYGDLQGLMKNYLRFEVIKYFVNKDGEDDD